MFRLAVLYWGEQRTCFKFSLCFVSLLIRLQTYEWESDYGPAWRFVGKHMHFTDTLVKLAEEYVREAAMRAGRMVVNNYATRAIDLLLPELEQGMFDPGWRIRVGPFGTPSFIMFADSFA